MNTLWEGSHFRNNGAPGSSDSHQLNLQAWGEVVQFNRIEQYASGATGSNLKSRGIQGVIRYNYLGDGASRQMDLVDVQGGSPLMSFESFLSGGANSLKAVNASDNYPADMMAAEQEAWNWHFVYGNIYDNGTSSAPIHFSEDHDGGETSRKGSLFWYNNTFRERLCANCSGDKWTLFDTSAGGGNFSSHVEWQTVQAYNNIIWMDNPAKPIFQWNNFNTFIGVAGKNLLTAKWGTNDTTGGPGTGWNNDPNPLGYQGAVEPWLPSDRVHQHQPDNSVDRCRSMRRPGFWAATTREARRFHRQSARCRHATPTFQAWVTLFRAFRRLM